jgi:hypothetical protein
MSATQATQQAKETAEQAAGQARDRVRSEVDRRSTEAGDQATSVADAMRQSAQQLREQGKEGAAKPMENVAERVERAGSWLRESDGDSILRDVEDFGRRQPMAVIAGGMVVGFALSRLLKASSTKRYEASRSNGAGAGAGVPQTTTTTGAYGGSAPEPPAAPSPGFPQGAPTSTTPPAHMPPVAPPRPDGPGGI